MMISQEVDEKQKVSEWHRPHITSATAKRFSSTIKYTADFFGGVFSSSKI
jgi:hypothetical protein